jgi:hypothetical protein
MTPDASVWSGDPIENGETALDARTAVYIARHAVPEMTVFGYSARPVALSKKDHLLLSIVDEPLNLAGAFARAFRRSGEQHRIEAAREAWKHTGAPAGE